MARVAFIGLGVMGAPMAGHLARAGHEARGWARRSGWAAAWAARRGGTAAATLAEALDGADALITCVGGDADLGSLLLGEADGVAIAGGALAALKPGALVIDHTTASPGVARTLAAACAARGLGWLDAPVSGGQAGAEAGKLSVMAGGEAAAFQAARPLLEAYAARIVHIGPAGHGQLAKLVNQIAIAGLVEGLAEALAFGRAAGLDMAATLEAVRGGAAQSWQMDNRSESMLDGRFDFGFAVAWMRKDLGLALAEARAIGAALPVAALVDQFYAEVAAMGGSRWDTSSLIARLPGGGA
jgi:3-hydroxyisobutyrate dehydrogenase-like beta-hydroxyacid dehydrogenase